MAKLDYEPKILDNQIVRDGLCAVSTLSKNPASKGLYFIVGGVATQSYLPSSCRRPTSDIDLAILKPLNFERFKNFSKTVYEYLGDNKYEVENRKAQRAFCIDYSKDGQRYFIEFSRHSEDSIENKAMNLEREKANSRNKIIEGTTLTCTVACPEDIIAPKLARSVNSLTRNPAFEKYVARMNDLSDEEIKKNLKAISELRAHAIDNIGDVRDAELLRFVSDLYDTRLLSELSGVNLDYFKKSANCWHALSKKTFERDLVSRAVLPDELIF